MRAVLASALIWCLCVSVTSAQQVWAKKMFTVTSHDFGTVAHGAKTEFRFPIKNVFVEDVVITGIRSSCGCTTPTLVAKGESASQPTLTLKTYEVGEVLATFNTHIMTGYKRATLTLTISKPYPAEIQLTVQGNIITDINVSPNYVDLSTVNQGEQAEKTVNLTRSGRRDWKINDVRCANTNFEVEVIEKARTLSSVSYELKVRLKESAPAGSINDQLVLMTNDDRMPQLPIQVQGEVRPELSITPNLWMAGALNPGEEIKKTIVVRTNSKKPFKIVKIQSEDSNVRYAELDPNASAKALHVLPITLVAPEQPGYQNKKIRIETDLNTTIVPEISLTYMVKGTVQPQQNLTGTDNKSSSTQTNPNSTTQAELPAKPGSVMVVNNTTTAPAPGTLTTVTPNPGALPVNVAKQAIPDAAPSTGQVTPPSPSNSVRPAAGTEPVRNPQPQPSSPSTSRRNLFRAR